MGSGSPTFSSSTLHNVDHRTEIPVIDTTLSEVNFRAFFVLSVDVLPERAFILN
jgi:hypothetical protein